MEEDMLALISHLIDQLLSLQRDRLLRLIKTLYANDLWNQISKKNISFCRNEIVNETDKS